MSGDLKEFEVIESKAYIVHAYDEEQALSRFGNYRHISEGDYWSTVRELGTVPADDDHVTYS
jgi:hypothetical protein